MKVALPRTRFKVSLDIGTFDFFVSIGNDSGDPEPQPQGSTSGDLSRAPGWDHDTREPVVLGFQANPNKKGLSS